MNSMLKIRNFLLSNSQISRLPADKESLWDEGAIDSLGILQLVYFLESEFSIKIPDKDINLNNFKSIYSISEYVKNKAPGLRT